MSLWSIMKLLAKEFSLEKRARFVAAVLPRRHWFRAAVLLSRWHAHLSAIFRNRRPGIAEAYLRENWLNQLTRVGPFPVPIRANGAELLQPAESERAGVVLCGTHVPFIMVVIRSAILSGHRPDLVVTDQDNIRLENSHFQPTGMDHGVPAVPPGAAGLLRIRSVLRKKGLVACTLDRDSGGDIHPDLLILAGRLGARAVTFRAELASDGIVDIAFQNTIHPYCESREAIKENLSAILAAESELLRRLSGVTDTKAPIAVLSQPDQLTDPPIASGESPVPIQPASPVTLRKPA